MWDQMVENFRPAEVLCKSLEPDRRTELDRAMEELFERDRQGDAIHHERLYLLVTGIGR